MYKVIGAPATRAFRVMWMLEELGQPYEVIPVKPASKEARDYNPSGKVPALVDGEETLTDSVAIMQYLADKHGGLTAPAGTPQRARQDAMLFWLIDEFDAILWAAAKHSFVFPEDMRVPIIKDSLKAEFLRASTVLANRLDGPFLMGDEITVPDLLAVHCINWSIGAKFPKVDERLGSWAAELRKRDAFKAVRAQTSS
ncbi:glutathione S-transferase family protein [Sulfitobacter donghicola]|uniref:Glutathione S-transferase n=1 Tax=Sulfitobacter donghicola DSW-25 = KCTC 12864 = JCM 14565 TaxID=1300350 RepID=A0A073IKZ0_9RHOB|nr:glutathione S-transferase family protein [Sulfitobacter donghicola]KEJ90434.1 glutathione S-transferase [Sulfitobacter donghicola DSW-25 = KCTC 12864 = JCM 14565]KIN67665.1 Glutathione S-transferase family protein [Sulfitobacter donghicola DSW-25 = KCTC 12864 = JCM 14565]